jgi:hypothetical protein
MSTSPKRLDDRIYKDLALALDPCGVFEACVGTPDKWQRDLLESDAQRVLLCCCRQSGKSSASAAIALRQALFYPESLVLLVSPSLRQSGELFRKVSEFYHKLEGAEQPELESILRLELKNGSRVIALPGSEATVRGYSAADVIVIDESARVEDSMLAAIRPATATKPNARHIYLSTPWGKRGFFYTLWDQGGDSWERYSVTAKDCPRISATFLEGERRALGELMYRSEYDPVEFLDAESQVVPTELIEAAMTDEYASFDF